MARFPVDGPNVQAARCELYRAFPGHEAIMLVFDPREPKIEIQIIAPTMYAHLVPVIREALDAFFAHNREERLAGRGPKVN